jgi:hypothetical protein
MRICKHIKSKHSHGNATKDIFETYRNSCNRSTYQAYKWSKVCEQLYMRTCFLIQRLQQTRMPDHTYIHTHNFKHAFFSQPQQPFCTATTTNTGHTTKQKQTMQLQTTHICLLLQQLQQPQIRATHTTSHTRTYFQPQQPGTRCNCERTFGLSHLSTQAWPRQTCAKAGT